MICSLIMITLVAAEGYYCPYESIGYDGTNDMIYDYYSTSDGGATFDRLGETGWVTRDSYCGDKGDLSKNIDAGEEKCLDSVNKCAWDGTSCIANIDAIPDCIELCQAVLDGEGPTCLGGSCGSREDFYAICDNIQSPIPEPVIYGKCIAL